MNRYFLMLLSLTFFIAAACTNSKLATGAQSFKQIAWNEDTVHACYFLLLDEKNFSYRFIDKQNGKTTKIFYSGTYAFLDDANAGRYYLKYDNGLQPPGTVNYLIIESQHSYFIQNFTDGRNKMYLRIQKRASR